jgi:hypothetical protein
MTQVQFAEDDGGVGRSVSKGLAGGRHGGLQGQSKSLSRHQLEGMIEEMGFGLIDRFLIIQGQVQANPKPRCRRVFKLVPDDEKESKKRSAREYRVQTMDALFRRLGSIRGPADGSIVVQDALPIRLTVTELDES